MENILNHSEERTMECQNKNDKINDDIVFIMTRLNNCSKQKLKRIKNLIDKNISDNEEYNSAFTTYITV